MRNGPRNQIDIEIANHNFARILQCHNCSSLAEQGKLHPCLQTYQLQQLKEEGNSTSLNDNISPAGHMSQNSLAPQLIT